MQLQARLDDLKGEIQALRQRLNTVTDGGNYCLQSEQAILVSEKLDQLIAEFLRIKEAIALKGAREQASGDQNCPRSESA